MSPADASRLNRRQERRRLVKLGQQALMRGFSKDLDDQVPVGVLLMLHDKLAETDNPHRAGEAAEMAEQVLERSNAVYERHPDVACKKGCMHCCLTIASVTPPEVFRIAHWLRQNRMHSAEMSPAAVSARCQVKRRDTLEEMFKLREACPALVDKACGVHGVRPISCRQFLSTSVAACAESFGGADTPIPFVTEATDRGTLARALLIGAMKSAGLPDTSFELSGALACALADASSEARWLAGEDVFAGAVITPRPQTTQELVDRCAGLVAQNA